MRRWEAGDRRMRDITWWEDGDRRMGWPKSGGGAPYRMDRRDEGHKGWGGGGRCEGGKANSGVRGREVLRNGNPLSSFLSINPNFSHQKAGLSIVHWNSKCSEGQKSEERDILSL